MKRTRILSYVPQPDEITCQAAACAQVVGTLDVATVRAQLVALGNPGRPETMQKFMEGRVKSYRLSLYGSLLEAARFLEDKPESRAVITHGWLTPSGHVFTMRRHYPNPEMGLPGFECDDPYLEFDFPNWQFMRGRSGNNVRYSYKALWSSCVSSENVQEARRLYSTGKFDLKEENAWMHFVEN